MEIESHIFDVVIAGYGPAGAMAANLLGCKGYRVAIVDRMLEIYDKPRAITADHEVMRALQECGLTDKVEPTTVPHPGTDFVGLDGQIIKRFYPQPAPFPLAWEPTWMFFQPELEAILREGVARFEQARTFLGYEVVDFEDAHDVARVAIKNVSDGALHSLKARYVLACDGGRSFFRRRLGVKIDDLAFDEWWIVLDALKKRDVELPPRMRQYCRPSRPGTYIVGPGDLRRWEMKILPHETPEMFEDETEVLKAWSSFVDVSAFELIRTAIYRFHALVLEEWHRGRVFLLGDAAHQMPPFLGQGLCAAVRDAYNLVWKIDAVERLGADPSILATYGQERKAHVKTVVEHAKEFGLIIGELDEQAARQRDARHAALIASGQAETVRQKFIPGLSSGMISVDAVGKPRPGAGDLFPQPWVRGDDGNWRRLDDILGTGFLIASDDRDILDGIDAETMSLWNELRGKQLVISGDVGRVTSSDPVRVAVEERDGVFRDWLSRTAAKAAVVRPDHYVFGTAVTSAELAALIADLHGRMFARPGQDAPHGPRVTVLAD